MSWQNTLYSVLFRLSKWRLAGKDFATAKRIMHAMSDERAAKAKPPEGAITCAETIDGVACEWVRDEQVNEDTRRVLLYFHGGGFFGGSPSTHRAAAHRFSASTRMQVLVVDYQLTPEAVFPAQLDEAARVYRTLLERGYSNRDIAFAGDSAGGNMAIAVLKYLQRDNIPLPFASASISPWADLTHSGESWQKNRRKDAMVPQSLLENAAPVYAAGTPLDDPLVSPVFAELTGLPPLYITAGGEEILLDDAVRLHANAMRDGVYSELQIWPGLPHAFTSMASILPEAQTGIDAIAQFFESAQSRCAETH